MSILPGSGGDPLPRQPQAHGKPGPEGTVRGLGRGSKARGLTAGCACAGIKTCDCGTGRITLLVEDEEGRLKLSAMKLVSRFLVPVVFFFLPFCRVSP